MFENSIRVGVWLIMQTILLVALVTEAFIALWCVFATMETSIFSWHRFHRFISVWNTKWIRFSRSECLIWLHNSHNILRIHVQASRTELSELALSKPIKSYRDIQVIGITLGQNWTLYKTHFGELTLLFFVFFFNILQ